MPLASHETQIRVRYQETDGQRRVHHANFLTYFEVARTEMLRARGATYREFEDAGLFLVVAEASCRYRAAAEYDDLLLVRTYVEKIGGASIEHNYEVSASRPSSPAVRPRWSASIARAASAACRTGCSSDRNPGRFPRGISPPAVRTRNAARRTGTAMARRV